MKVDELVDQAYEHARRSGFHDGHPLEAKGARELDHIVEHIRLHLSSKLALIHSEVSEALEEVRDNTYPLTAYNREDGKPEGVTSELADVVIRVADLCGSYDLDLEGAIEEKLRYNTTRPPKHGKHL